MDSVAAQSCCHLRSLQPLLHSYALVSHHLSALLKDLRVPPVTKVVPCRLVTHQCTAVTVCLKRCCARGHCDLVPLQAARFSRLDRGCMTVWEALEMLGSLREYETALLAQPGTDPAMPLLEHCFQTAEACRVAYPQEDWLHLVGLIHSLGKLLGHSRCAPPA